MAGSCYCEAVTFESMGPSKWCGHCHCTICRRIPGSGVVTWVGFEQDNIRIGDPEGTLHWYESSQGSGRGSCNRCGSQLFYRSDKWPGELHIVRAAFTTPVDREPEGHAFYDTHVDWLTLQGAPDS